MPKKGRKARETEEQAHQRRIHSITAKAWGITDAQYTEYKNITEKEIPKKLKEATPGKERAAWNELRCFIDAADPLLHKKIQMSGKKEATTRRALGIRGLPLPEEVIKNIAEEGRLTALEFLNTIKTRMGEIETIAKQSSSSEQGKLTNSGQSNLTNSGQSYLTDSGHSNLTDSAEGNSSPSPREAQPEIPTKKKSPRKGQPEIPTKKKSPRKGQPEIPTKKKSPRKKKKHTKNKRRRRRRITKGK